MSERQSQRRTYATDRALKAFLPQPKPRPNSDDPPAKEYDVFDTLLPGMSVRVSPRGRKTFNLIARYPGSSNPVRRSLGVYGVISLDDARKKARAWLEAIQKGHDPKLQAERDRRESIKREAVTFEAVVADFVRDKLAKERKGTDAKREIDLDLMPVWRGRPITDITDLDVIAVINRKKRKVVVNGKSRGGPVGARNLLALIKRFFRWAAGKKEYGLTVSPTLNIRAADILDDDASVSRDRVLTGDELFAFWRATDSRRMPYPVGPAYRLLILTALRLREAVEAQKMEIDAALMERIERAGGKNAVEWRDLPADRAVWIIPKARMKGRNIGKKIARAHAVPMTDEILAIFAHAAPLFKGRYLFSNTLGQRPVSFGTKIKYELDRRMLRTLKAMARLRGQDPANVVLPHFVNHDLRRTVRSHLSRLKIEEVAREAVLAHARHGIQGVYDQHDYLEEKREALTLWATRLQTIVNRPVRNT